MAFAGACATECRLRLPATLAYPEFLYPQLPAALAPTPGASRVDVGWRYLQGNDLKNAESEFGVALKLGPRLYPARTGQGYVALAMRDYDRALTVFDAALEGEACVRAGAGRTRAGTSGARSDAIWRWRRSRRHWPSIPRSPT